MRKLVAAVLISFCMGLGARGQERGGAPASAAAKTQESCESLQRLVLPGAKVTSAVRVAAGEFAPPSNATPRLAGSEALRKKLPAFCRLAVVATPSADSAINIEVWLPESGWNGKFRGQGNGGFAGEIIYLGLETAVLAGYASASTDTGHSGTPTDAKWALGHPEKVTDFGYRAIHEMTRISKAAAEAYYGSAPRRSYFASCSNGGRQGLMEAQRYPEDYDGILAGAPANDFTHLLTNALSNAQALTSEEGSYIPASKIPALARVVNAACDAQDGVADGLVNDPRRCRFDPSTMLCKDSDSDQCLTAKQVTTMKKLYSGGHDAHGNPIFPGYVPGAEDGQAGWILWITGLAPGKSLLFAFSNGFFSNMVYEKADWNYKDANLDAALKLAEEKTARKLNATDTDLSHFKARGGKLVLYHGWNDPAISALNTVDYFERVVKKMGRPGTEPFARLYLLPGMQHCGSGPGPNSFGEWSGDSADPQRNISLALEQWVEKGIAPGAVIATKYVNDEERDGVKMRRPLCPYPQVAQYKGSGDTNDAKNFICAAASK
jgi:feruloyl esterase